MYNFEFPLKSFKIMVYTSGQFHKSMYQCFLIYKLVEPVLNYRCNKFVALTNLCETGPSTCVQVQCMCSMIMQIACVPFTGLSGTTLSLSGTKKVNF